MPNRLSEMLGIAPGMLFPTADPGTTDPPGFLVCDGRAVSRTTYAALFARLGTSWGAGNGSTTFNIPDLQGRVPIGAGTGSGLTARTVSQSGGAETHTLTENQMPNHGHPFRASYTSQASPQTQTTGGFPTTTTGDAAQPAHTGSAQPNQGQQIGGTGGGAAHNNMQPFAVIRWLVKT
ncbi:MAG: Microbacterium phage TinyTimothy [Planctomycetota bacterium]|jgi:microcystin-dependent protein